MARLVSTLLAVFTSIFTFSLGTSEAEKNYFSKTNPDVLTCSDDYQKRFKGRTGKWFLVKQSSAVLSCLAASRDSQGQAVLEIGGGHGQLLPYLRRSGYSVTIVGSSPQACLQIEDDILNGNCDFHVSPLDQLNFAARSFDSVVSVRVLAHLDNWRLFVSEMCRVAESTVVIDYSSTRSVNLLAGPCLGLKRLLEGEVTTRPYNVFSESELIAEFNKLGFSLSQRIPQYFLPMVFHRTIAYLPISKLVESLFAKIGLTQVLGSPVIASFRRDLK